MINNIAVYCGSSAGNNDCYIQGAKDVGNWLVDNQWGLVYGGATIGLMGTLASTILDRKGNVAGIMTTHLAKKEISFTQLTEYEEVADMHARKKRMMEKSDGFIALPGGCGTMEEIFEVITWSQIGLHEKPYAFYNINGYYDTLQQFFSNMCAEGFISEKHFADILISSSLDEIYAHFISYQSPGEKQYS